MPVFVWPLTSGAVPIPPVVTLDDGAFGVDLDCVTDISPQGSLARGIRNLANALLRRLITPRGGLFYDPDYGFDLRDYLSAGLTDAELQALSATVALELEKDERVKSALVTQLFIAAERRLQIRCIVTTQDPTAAPFALVLAIGAVTSEILDIAA